ncbi:hypothetical protein JD844_017377 [Phrynosoma platyrhinos]|uniref:Ig-like domain-containing protein n=1 Tax=Phrynosoma platyrhinos TaxID=52577 RepID=A0ABQ7SLW0_PHRPL|nr:hypothetical protein JD844_017377 [Phrynosoma platyrhinos]
MSIGAIKIALEISLPGSFIYVFTDARSKDYKLTHEVLQLIQQKQSQVVFVLTGDCDDRAHIGYKVYEEIASTSSGQVFHLDKKQVNEVLKWVEEAVQASKVHLLSTDHLTSAVNAWHIPFDPSLKEVTVSLSGLSPTIEVHDPLGKLIKKGSGLKELLNIENSAKVVNIKDPEPGMWTVKVLNFSQSELASESMLGIPTYILLNTTGINPPARVDRLELLSITGDLLKTIPVKYFPDRKPYGIWNITEFIPPNEAFFLKITGYDKDDYLFQRISSVSFSNIIPDAPKVSMPKKTPGYYLQPGHIPCQISSLIPITMYFSRNGIKLGMEQFFKESAVVNWEIAKVSLSDEGYYECIASSGAGTGRAQTFFDVSEPPPIIQVPNNVTVTPGDRAILTCLTVSTVRYNLTWYRNNRDLKIMEPSRIRILSNLSLEVKVVKLSDAGEYNCVASNEGGTTVASVFLTVQEPPKATVSPKDQSFTEGSEVSISCSATGYPKPTIVWMHNEMFLMGSHRLTVVQSELLIALGDTTVMECKSTGVPPPHVKWFKGDLELRASEFLIIDIHQGLLKIQETQDLDAGDYMCVATNIAGSASGKITLDVGSPPVFTQEPSDESADIGSNVTLACYVQGYPEPKVKWQRQDGIPLFARPFPVSSISQLRTGALSINNLWVNDEGTYICEAENQFGKIISRLATLTVTGLVAPLIGMGPAVANVIEGQQLTLSCVLLAGNPIPERKWIKNSMVVVQTPYINVRSDGSLHLERVQLQDAGDYTCMASNVAGTHNKTTAVSVFVLPIIQHGQQIFNTIEGISVTLPCKASGVPKPSIVWSKKGEVIPPSNLKFSSGSDGSLYIVSPGGEESGEYICTATNPAGYATRRVQLTVYVKPRVSRLGNKQRGSPENPLEMSVIAGEDVTLPCEVKSLPPPIITWAKEIQLISPFSPRHTFLPSGSLKITETRVSDSGMYICVATNIAGNATQSVKLNVHVPPKIQRGPRVIKTKVGHRVDLPCNAQGIPPPMITWFKDQNPVLIDNRQHALAADGTLSIIKVLLSDYGIYKCRASNIAGHDEAEIMIHVQESPSVGALDPPYNTPFQERVANQRIAFPCPAKGTPQPVIKWLHNNRELTGNEPGISILEDGTLLVISSVTPYNNGEYVCIAVNEAGSTERTYNLKVHVPPEIRDQDKMTNASVTINQPISIFCEVSGSPFPIITWHKHDIQVVESSTLQILNNGKLLKLLKASTDDAGQYSCKATNIAGSSEKFFSIDVQVPPTIEGADTPSEASVILNQETTLECRVSGSPFPIVQWFKDGKPLFIGDPNIEILDKGQILHIKSARRIDKGHYQCSAANAVVPPLIEGDSETIQNKQVVAGSSLVLECNAAGNPPPLLTWLKDGVPVKASDNLHIVFGGRKLEILNTGEADQGQYVCVATSIAGEKEIKYDVEILVPPNIEGGDESSDYIVILHSPLELDCPATGTPLPTITWLKNGQPIEGGVDYKILLSGRKLLISQAEVSDTGHYQCTATNKAGDNKKEFAVTVHVPPTIKSTGPAERSVVIHKPVTMQCIANGIPSPSITWLKDNQPVNTARANVRLESSGRILQLPKAITEDAGRYTCIATNAAGEAQHHVQLHVYEPPNLKDAGKMINETVIVNNPIQLECKASGNPLPVITWYKDNRPLTGTASITFLNRGQVVQIDDAQISDTGLYKCIVSNAAGVAELFYSLQVHVSPYISGKNEMVTVVVNNPVRLECEARGIPVPILTWLKDGSPVSSFSNGLQILSGGRILALTSARISDTGRYTCVAVNAAGEKQRDIDLRVHVPPNIMGEEQNVSLIMGEDLELQCQSNAIPPPTLEWLKDGRPLSNKLGYSITDDGSVLKIKGAQAQDSGRYTCEATNVAGKMEKNYNVNVWGSPLLIDPTGRVRVLSGGRQLQISIAEKSDTASYVCMASNVAGIAKKEYNLLVYVRPTILDIGSQQSDVTLTRGNDISLECKAEGIPKPAVTWMKDGQLLVNGRGAEILNEGHRLQLKNIQVSDTGRYVCVAMNVAGLADRKYDLSVHVPPSIVGDLAVAENISVVEKNPITLTCEASGIPHPSITWLKYGQPVLSSSSVRVLSGGRMLRLMQLNVEDAGCYTCVVTNIAGEERKNFDLSVLVPPGIVGENKLEDVKVKESQGIMLTCEVTGSPIPNITWLKDGQPFVEDDNHELMSNGRFLQITNAQVADTGRYTCVASNAAGDKSKSFSVNILVSPSIVGADNDGGTEEVTVILNNPTSLVCEAYSYPPATITWLKDGVPIESNRNIRILPVPPTISRGDLAGIGLSPKEVKIRVNNSVTLECEAHAIPAAGIRWYKDGQASHQPNSFEPEFLKKLSFFATVSPFHISINNMPILSDDHITIQAGGRILQIKAAQISDTGRYSCIASNIAGEDELEFDVNIQVPPRFQKPPLGDWEDGNMLGTGQGGEAKYVIMNNPFSLYCETNAVPPPVLTWYKDGYPLSSSDKVLILPGGRVLQIPRAQSEDAGQYMCVAVNEAGEDSIQYDVRVLLPPSINGPNDDMPEEVTVVLNKMAVMECMANGNPIPNITWQKDGQFLFEDSRHRFIASGRTLQILSSQIADTGRYVCLVENMAGSAKKYFNLNVHVPPSIVGINPENLTVVVNNFISLTCEVTGFPPPDLSWLKNGKPLSLNTNALIIPGGRTLQIPRARLSDGGEYVCIARNIAGESRRRSFLTVYVPPSIKDHGGTALAVVNVKVRMPVTLECESNAVPPPVITWYKNGHTITVSSKVGIIADGQMLHIKAAEVSDTGQYVCKAINIAGRDDKNFHLNVHVPPTIEGPEQEWINETISNPVTFTCDATGIPPPAITWLKNGKPLVPPDIAGSEIPSEVSVLHGEDIQLSCEANGIPKPVIQWLKDGKPVGSDESQRISLAPDASLLTIFGALASDVGKYTCVATNPAGEEDRIFNVNVYVPPIITNNKDEPEALTALLDTSINIECQAVGTPLPQINWLKNGLPLSISSHIRLLSAGHILRIVRTQIADVGMYTCVASNRAGVDNKHYSLHVYVPPSIDNTGGTEEVIVLQGNPVSLVCLADGTPAPRMSWLKDGQPLRLGSRVTLENQQMGLHIVKSEADDMGRYTCIASNEAGEVNKHFTLKVLEPPRINGSGHPEEISIVINNPLELFCISDGIPVPKITWMKDGRPLPQTNDIHILRGGEILRISSAQVEDTGRYTCLASSPAGDDDKEYLATPRVRILSSGRYLQINNADLSDKGSYTCIASNIAGQMKREFVLAVHGFVIFFVFVLVRYSMSNNGSLRIHSAHMMDTGRYLCMATNVAGTERKRIDFHVHGSLVIISPTVDDTGLYECTASNEAGKDQRTIALTVQVPPSLADEATDLLVTKLSPVVIPCTASGVPTPAIHWTKNGIKLLPLGNGYRILASGAVEIMAAKLDHAGKYTCTAHNAAGFAHRHVALHVQVPPTVRPHPEEYVVVMDKPVTLLCEAGGYPAPEIAWHKDGQQVTESMRQRILSTGSLQIAFAHPSDTGRYTCTATNVAGSSSSNMELTVLVPPKIRSAKDHYSVVENSQVLLSCVADGIPTPSMKWKKDGILLMSTMRKHISGTHGDLFVDDVVPEDTGIYTCIASNVAGEDTHSINLTVHVLPTFTELPGDVALKKGERLQLMCQAAGVPVPKITWTFNNNIIPGKLIHEVAV